MAAVPLQVAFCASRIAAKKQNLPQHPNLAIIESLIDQPKTTLNLTDSS
jgi:hypothetical protein